MNVLANVCLDLIIPKFITVHAVQDDKLTRTVHARLLAGGLPWQVPSGALALVRFMKPDRTSGFYDTLEDGSPAVTVETGRTSINFTLAQQALAVPGDVFVQINFYTSAGAALSSFSLRVDVHRAVYSDSSIVSGDYYNALTATLADMAGEVEAFREAMQAGYGAPRVAATAADMTNVGCVYVYTGTTGGGLTYGHWYTWNGSAWTDGGIYQSAGINTDTTLTNPDMAANAKATGDRISAVEAAILSHIAFDGVTPAWAVGAINVSSGDVSTSSTQIRSTRFSVSAETLTGVSATAGYEFLCFGYVYNADTATTTYLGYWRGSAFSKSSGSTSYYVAAQEFSPLRAAGANSVRIVARRADGVAMTTAEAANLSRVISLPATNAARLDEEAPKVAALDAALEYLEPMTGFVKGKNITTNLSTGTVVDVNNPTSSATMSYKIVECSAGDRFLLTGKSYNAPRLWAFTDEEYKLLLKSASDATVTDLELTAPADGYLIVNIVNTRTYSLARYVKNYTIATDLKNLQDEVAEIIDGSLETDESNLTALVEAQKSIAEDWHFAFINVFEGMGLGANHLIPGTATIWSQSGTSDLNQKSVWMSDGVHPFKGAGVTEMYARTIAAQLVMVPPSYRDGVGETSPSLWAGRKFLWMGTSIPAGSDPDAGEGTGATYPALVAQQLGATVTNRARGSSCVRINASTGNYTGMIFSHFIRAITRTVAECDAIAADWDNIKDQISLAPETLSAGNVTTMKNHSYENLILPWLDGTNTMPDLFVIDYGHNDVRPKGVNGKSDLWITPTAELITEGMLAEDTYMTSDNYANLKLALNNDLSGISNLADFAASLNRNCFKGAVNFLITVILRYNPYARIAIVSDYN